MLGKSGLQDSVSSRSAQLSSKRKFCLVLIAFLSLARMSGTAPPNASSHSLALALPLPLFSLSMSSTALLSWVLGPVWSFFLLSSLPLLFLLSALSSTLSNSRMSVFFYTDSLSHEQFPGLQLITLESRACGSPCLLHPGGSRDLG